MVHFFDPKTLIVALSFVAIFAGILAIGLPFLHTDKRDRRLKHFTKRSEQLNEEVRTELAQRRARARAETKLGLMKKFREGFKLQTLTLNQKIRDKLATAGWRSRSAVVTFVFARFALAAAFSLLALLLLPFMEITTSFSLKFLIIVAAGKVGYSLPNIWVQNMAAKRRQELNAYYTEALDFLGICVNGGQSIEAAFNKVTEEIFDDSPIMSEEMGLTAAELSFLGDRTTAYRNFAVRTNLPAVKALSTTLAQSEKYGTPLSQALNVLSEENRKERMSRLEKKAASLPAKLTVPMIVFFLPVLFVVILGPAALGIM